MSDAVSSIGGVDSKEHTNTLFFKLHFFPQAGTDLTQFGIGVLDKCVEQFFDTPNNDLVRANSFLRLCSDTWTLTTHHRTEANGRVFTETKGVEDSVQKHGQILGIRTAARTPLDYCWMPLAVFSTSRMLFQSSGAYLVYLDCSRIQEQLYYLAQALKNNFIGEGFEGKIKWEECLFSKKKTEG